MNTPKIPAVDLARVSPADRPDAVTEEWCRMHRLIEELSTVQRRLGTPLEQPDDFTKVRGLGSHIRERLDSLTPFVGELAEVGHDETVA